MKTNYSTILISDLCAEVDVFRISVLNDDEKRTNVRKAVADFIKKHRNYFRKYGIKEKIEVLFEGDQYLLYSATVYISETKRGV